jgi:hypothetical protein
VSPEPEADTRALPDGLRIRLGTEFGHVMAALVADVRGALGAALTDHTDDAVDYAHMADEMSEFDIEVTAAQVGDTARRTHAQAVALGLGRSMLVVETERRVLLLGMPRDLYLLTLVLDPRANLAVAMGHFRADLRRIAWLLA